MPAVAKNNKAKAIATKKTSKKPLILSNRNNKRSPRKPTVERNEKGIIYVKHLPHGFFENQLRTFFSQFGDVTRVHVARSKKTLRSRGYAYVEFRYREVAQIAAETMNNYLMFGKLLKTGLLPVGAKRIPRKYEKAYDANGNETTTYKLWLKKMIAKSNSRVTKTKVVNRNLRALGKLKTLKSKYAQMGIEYNIDDVIPDFCKDDLKVPIDDAEEAELEAKRNSRKTKKQETIKTSDTNDKNVDVEMTGDSSDDDEDDSFLPLKSTDWDVAIPDDETIDDGADSQGNKKDKKQAKLAALELANTTKVRLDKEKNKHQNKKRPLVLRPPSSTESSPEKPITKKKLPKSVNASTSQTISESNPTKAAGGHKNKLTEPKSTKGEKITTGGVKKNTKIKKEKPKVQKNVVSAVKDVAKAMLQDPSVKKVKAKDIKKKKKN